MIYRGDMSNGSHAKYKFLCDFYFKFMNSNPLQIKLMSTYWLAVEAR